MILVNTPFLPPKEEFNTYLSSIWNNKWLTNDGLLVRKLENQLCKYLKLENLVFVNNGTNALMLAIKALDLKGEIITTPFSFVATTSSIVWENCTPVFVDIDATSLNIDANKIEQAITDKTSAILATHVYGNPCDVIKIAKIAKKHNLKVIYDAAHAFGIKYQDTSIFEYGDISICSTHATKVFHTTEGGFLVTKNKEIFKILKSARNFGFKDYKSFSHLGINAKNSEFHAAMGLVNLKYQDHIFEKRKHLTKTYDKYLLHCNKYTKSVLDKNYRNYSYYPVLFSNEAILLKCAAALKEHQIFTRRYFYPSLANSLPYVKNSNKLPIVEDIASRILCLPLFYDLKETEVIFICHIITKTLQKENLKARVCQ